MQLGEQFGVAAVVDKHVDNGHSRLGQRSRERILELGQAGHPDTGGAEGRRVVRRIPMRPTGFRWWYSALGL
jgi:hypothetical protein